MATKSNKEKTETVIIEHDSVFRWIDQIIVMCNKYGIIKMIFAVFFMVFIAYASYIAFNPEVVFDKYSEYIEKQHSESMGYRLEQTPFIQTQLDNLVRETGAIRAYIIEMHNGKNNPSGLSFIYGSMKYEAVQDTCESVSEDYSDFSIERFPLISKVYSEGYWEGNTEELLTIDKRFAYRVISNDGEYIALITIYGVKEEIGYLGITFGKTSRVKQSCIKDVMTKYAMKLAPLLDGYKSRNRQ